MGSKKGGYALERFNTFSTCVEPRVAEENGKRARKKREAQNRTKGLESLKCEDFRGFREMLESYHMM